MGRLSRPKTNRLNYALTRFCRKALLRIGFANPVYALKLKGPHPLRLLATPTTPWAGDPSIGAQLASGSFYHAGQTLFPATSSKNSEAYIWSAQELWQEQHLPKGWMIWLHGFSWLKDLAAAPDKNAARKRAETLTKEWLQHFDKWEAQAWRPDILARRLISWMTYAPLIISTNDHVYRSLVLNSMARQSRHLARSLEDAPTGTPRLVAVIGLVYTGLFLPSSNARLRLGITELERELQAQVLADGGTITRNPADLFELLRDLVALRAAFVQRDHDVPEALQGAIDRMGPMLKSLCHGDRRLALFNGSVETRAASIEETLTCIGDVGEAFGNAPHTGFQRLSRGRSLVIMDAGPPSPLHYSRNNHAGTLSFEMSDGPDRIVVNSGSAISLPEGRPAAFQNLKPSAFNLIARATAAHSTLVVNDTNSSEVLQNSFIGNGPTEVTFERHEEDGGIWLEASHNGYDERFSLIHVRRLFLNKTGSDFRGEDILRRSGRRLARSDGYDIRFHLHPRVETSIDEEGSGIILRMPSGQGWHFRARGGRVSLDESLYLGKPHQPATSQHILVTGQAGPGETVINWSFKCLEPEG